METVRHDSDPPGGDTGSRPDPPPRQARAVPDRDSAAPPPPASVWQTAARSDRQPVPLLRRLLDRWCVWRDGLLASDRFRHWAIANPLTRPIARRRTRLLFNLCAGFVYTQVLLACVRLDLFDRLRGGPIPLGRLAEALSIPVDRLERLLEAAVPLGLLQRRGGRGSARRYGLGPLGAAVAGNPGVAILVEHHALLYGDLTDPLPLLRGDAASRDLADFWAYGDRQGEGGQGDDGRFAAYSRVMAASQPMVAAEVVAAYPFRHHRHLLDIGGGAGVFLSAVAAVAPDLRLTLFDLPPVAAVARQRLAACGAAARATVVGGRFLQDPLPAGADLVTLIRVLHDHDDATVTALLRKVHAALPPGGTLVVAEMMRAGDDRPGSGDPVTDAYFDFYLMAMGDGRLRSPARIMALLDAAGFKAARLLPTRSPLMARVISARTP